jgi:hypothetical protein
MSTRERISFKIIRIFVTRPQNFSNPVLGQNFKECRFDGALNY